VAAGAKTLIVNHCAVRVSGAIPSEAMLHLPGKMNNRHEGR
jgi:hypothetical protein